MLGIFKKRLSYREAAAILVNMIIRRVKESWYEDKQTLIFLNGDNQMDDVVVPFEIVLAAISLEYLAIQNTTTPLATANIWHAILEFTTNIEQYGDYAEKALTKDYKSGIRLAEEQDLPAYEGIVYLFAEKMDIQLDTDPIARLQLLDILVKKSGAWKYILKEFKVG